MAGPQFQTYSNPNPFTSGSTYGGGGGRMGESGGVRDMMTGNIPEPFFRDQLDMQRSMFRRTPSSEYPDGYLGTMRTRRDDRLLKSVQERINQRQYQRGVHKGERIDPQDYYWPEDFQPTNGLDAIGMGVRQAPLLTLSERFMATEQQMIPRGAQSLVEMNSERADALRRLLPKWR